MTALEYLHLPPDCPPPQLRGAPFRAVVVIEAQVTPEWRASISKWLVESGCLYMMAWGTDCSLWDDSVDYANLDKLECGDIPDDSFVMTTWHPSEPLEEVFWFCEYTARHSTVDLDRKILIHISIVERDAELLDAYQRAAQV
jgi:hypothetical protein